MKRDILKRFMGKMARPISASEMVEHSGMVNSNSLLLNPSGMQGRYVHNGLRIGAR